jgi:hypothetical protein
MLLARIKDMRTLELINGRTFTGIVEVFCVLSLQRRTIQR